MSWSRWTGTAAAALLLGAGIAVTAPAEAATVPVTTGIGRTLGGDGHSFSVPAGYPGGSLVRAWSHTFSGTLATPLVVGSAVVAATTGTAAGSTWADLQAFDGATGTALWPPVAIGTEVSSLASDGQRVFAVSGQSVLGVDLATGRVLWDRKVSGVLFRTEVPTVYGGLLWVNDDDRTLGLTALDPATGAVVHAYPNDGTGATMALVGHTLYDSSCAIDLPSGTRLTGGSGGSCGAPDGLSQTDGTVVLSSAYPDATHLAVVDAASRRQLWSAPAGLAALDAGRLLVATSRKTFTLTSYDETTGAQRWSIGLPSRPAAQPIVFGGSAAVVTVDGHLRRYNTATGALVDDTVLAGKPVYPGFGQASSAAVDSGLLAVPGGKTLTVFRGSTTGAPASLRAAPKTKPRVTTATGLDSANGGQYAEDAAHDGVATGSTLTGPLHLAWSKALPGAVSNAVVDGTGRLFVASADPAGGFDVYRLNRRTGAVLWGPVHLTGGLNLTTTKLALADGVLVDYETGGSGMGSSALLHGLDPATGAVRWTTALAPEVYGYDGAPTISGGTVYVHCHDDRWGGLAWAFDLQTGALRWSTQIIQSMDLLAPAVGGGLVYYPGVDNQLYALDPATGRQTWHANSGDGGGTSSAVYANGRTYLNDFVGGGEVHDAATGQLTGPGMFAARRPAVDTAANAMIALQGNRITAESLTDRTRYWTVTDKSVPSVSPVVANGMVITGDNSGQLLVLSEATGAQLWSDPQAFAPTSVNLVQGTEPAQLTVGAGGLALTSGSSLRFYAGAVDNGPATP